VGRTQEEEGGKDNSSNSFRKVILLPLQKLLGLGLTVAIGGETKRILRIIVLIVAQL